MLLKPKPGGLVSGQVAGGRTRLFISSPSVRPFGMA